MSGNNNRQKVHQAVDRMTSAATPDPWLAQKVRLRAQGKEEEPMKKKLPAGLVIVIAVLFMMTAVAAAVTSGFGLLRFYPEQSENTAFMDRIVSVGQTWEGKYFDAEIREAVFDGSKLRFSMSVTPKEGAEKVFILPVMKAECDGKALQTECSLLPWYTSPEAGVWVPQLEPPVRNYGYELGDKAFDLNDMVFEAALIDHDHNPVTVTKDVQWTLSFEVMHTDWKISFADVGLDDFQTLEQFEAFQKQQYEAYNHRELLLDKHGDGLFDTIAEPYTVNGALEYTGDYDDFLIDLYTRNVFTWEERAVFSFVAEQAQIRKLQQPVDFTLPDEQRFEVTKAESTVSGVNVFVNTKYLHTHEFYDVLPWDFILKADDVVMDSRSHTNQSLTDTEAILRITYNLEYNANKPVSSVTLVPVQHTDSGDVERDDLAIVINLE